MKTDSKRRGRARGLHLVIGPTTLGVFLAGCSAQEGEPAGPDVSDSGMMNGVNSSSSGGASSTGGIAATGGADPTSGTPNTGGTSTGGVAATGGALSTGGAIATGGTTSTGGMTSSGGETSSGGSPSTSFDCSGEVGQEIGDTISDYGAVDSKGVPFSPRDFCGKHLVIEMGSPECPRCVRHASQMPEFIAENPNAMAIVAWYEGPGPRQNNGSIPTNEQMETLLPTNRDAGIISTHLINRDLRRNWLDFPSGTTPLVGVVCADGVISEMYNRGESLDTVQTALDACDQRLGL